MHNRIVIAVFALMLLAPAVSAETPYTISGQVLDQDGLPVVGATVYLHQYGRYVYDGDVEEPASAGSSGAKPAPSYEPQYYEAKTTTGPDGRFSLAAQAGSAHLSAELDGYGGGWEYAEISGDLELAMKMYKYPPRTAVLSGQLTGDGEPIKYGSISIEYPEFGQYECSTHDEDMRYAQPGQPVAVLPTPEGEEQQVTIMAPEPYPYPMPGCSIKLHSDGTFEGTVYPGYAIVRAYVDSWRGGREYYGAVQTMTLVTGVNTLAIEFIPLPGPDATLSGYILGPDQTPVVDAWVSLYNQESYRGGNAQTDDFGSYNVALRGGLVQVDVYAEGYLPWSGMVVVKGDKTFNVELTPGDSRYGSGCCYADDRMYPMPMAAGEGGVSAPASPVPAPTPPPAPDQQSAGTVKDQAGGQSQSDFADLGGLGKPYSPASEAASNDAPGLLMPLLALALLGAVALRRK